MNIIVFCKNYYFEIVVILCILFILIYGLYRIFKGEKGSWSQEYTYIPKGEKYISNGDLYDSCKNKESKENRESKGEKECRYVLENYFEKPFPKCRPNFLRNVVTGGDFNLELDCFNEELGIAVEYNGIQHEKYIPYFHKNKESFYNQKYRDFMKQKLCQENNILLITVPHTIKVCNIKDFILRELNKYDF
jgi:hypothetical protein